MVYGNYVTLDDAKKKSNTQASLPNWSSSGYYFGVQFPNRETQILNQMGIWLFSTLVLLIVILFFGYTLFVILKQKRLSEIQRDFINTMTHEFKTPISTIAVSAEVLKDPAILHQPERLLSYTAIIENENNRLKHHVERVLQMARIQPGGYREELKKEMTDLHELIRDTSASMGLGLAEKGGTLELDLQANPGSVMADRHHMANVLFNLLDNAIKYCNHTPHIRIATRTQSNTVLMTVTDNGIGISAENQNRIFEKFFRVNTGNVHNVKGFGLGLHYVQQIIHAHRGKISLTSTPGEGCCFTVTLPYA
jgi:two-component system phosphate regulon sensor histidine kinase PhoR